VDLLRRGGSSDFCIGATLFRVLDMRDATPDILRVGIEKFVTFV